MNGMYELGDAVKANGACVYDIAALSVLVPGWSGKLIVTEIFENGEGVITGYAATPPGNNPMLDGHRGSMVFYPWEIEPWEYTE